MLSERSARVICNWAAGKLTNPLLSGAVAESVDARANKLFYAQEFSLLDKVTGTVNALQGVSADSRDPNLINTYTRDFNMPTLPAMFSWSDREERKEWNKFLVETFNSLNTEISDDAKPNNVFKDPRLINNGNPQDIFRFFLWDGYALWKAKMLVAENPNLADHEQDVANVIVNAMCEAAVVLGEGGDDEMKNMASWLKGQDWVNNEWGFSPELIARFERLALPEEIERKFFVSILPNDLESFKHVDISQGYLAIDEATSTEVRIRKKGDKYYQTVKIGTGKRRKEVEVAITQEIYEELWPLTEGKRIEKTRYEIPHGEGDEKLTIELDVYHGKLEGLYTAEVEFKSEDMSTTFTAPNWFGQEVTEDQRFKNQSLAIHGIPQVE